MQDLTIVSTAMTLGRNIAVIYRDSHYCTVYIYKQTNRFKTQAAYICEMPEHILNSELKAPSSYWHIKKK